MRFLVLIIYVRAVLFHIVSVVQLYLKISVIRQGRRWGGNSLVVRRCSEVSLVFISEDMQDCNSFLLFNFNQEA